jgi:hypothetical protein
MTAKSMVFRETGKLLVLVHGTRPPAKDEWDAFLDLCRKKLGEGITGVLVVTAGGAPDAKQRKEVHDLLHGRTLAIAVVSDAALVRGVVSAFGWFNPAIHGFAFNKGAGLNDALRYLHVEGFVAAGVLLEVKAMQREVA